MAEYYYFVASLPSVWMDKEAPITYKEFLSRASEQLSRTDFEDLKKATFNVETNRKTKSKVVKDWENFEWKLNELLTEERAKNLNWDVDKYKAKCTPDRLLSEKLKKIVESPNPLKAEKEILDMYFEFLENHEVSSPFSTEALMIYALKLQIKEKAESFSKEKGRKEFDKLYGELEKQIFELKEE